MMTYINLSKISIIATGVLLSSMSFSAHASECKGLDNQTCVTNVACGWVESYERKDGRQVKAFCRTSNKGKVKVSSESKQDTKSIS